MGRAPVLWGCLCWAISAQVLNGASTSSRIRAPPQEQRRAPEEPHKRQARLRSRRFVADGTYAAPLKPFSEHASLMARRDPASGARPHRGHGHRAGAGRHHSGFYDCPVHGEAYTGAYFMERDVFENTSVIPEIFCSKVANMESGSFTLFPLKLRIGWKNEGTLLKTVDLFAFSVTHLSWLDRYLVQFGMTQFLRPWFVPHVVDRVNAFEWTEPPFRSDDVQNAADDTVVLMPFFATPNAKTDAGHSSLEMRRTWLALTFRGVSHFFKHVTVTVGTDFDQRYLLNASGLPFFDVLRIPAAEMGMHVRGVPDPNVPFKAGCMGLATLVTMKRKLAADPRYARFRYVYYTESDQLPHLRNFGAMLHTMREARSRGTYVMYTPHRLVPFFTADELRRHATPLREEWAEQRDSFLTRLAAYHGPPRVEYNATSLHDDPAACCFSRVACNATHPFQERVHASDPSLAILRFPTAPFAVLAGEPDFHAQAFRPCTLQTDSPTCPR